MVRAETNALRSFAGSPRRVRRTYGGSLPGVRAAEFTIKAYDYGSI
jgi:hypothetical protein